MPETPDLSVIIATRNRAESLRDTLNALAHQQTEGVFTYEVLVVDNGSTDSTRGVVKERQAACSVPLRYCYEGRQGKPFALNTGLQQVRGQLLAFTDDDVIPTSTWLHALWRCFREEQADGVAGRILPLWTAPRPAWLTDEVAMRLGGIGCVDHGSHRLSSLAQHDCRWVGGNLAMRQHAIQRVGTYDIRMIRAQDTEYYMRCVKHGLKIIYEPAAVVYHKVGVDRMTPEYFRSWCHATGHYKAYALPWKVTHLATPMSVWWYCEMLRLAWRWIRNFLTRGPWAERFCNELRLRWNFSIWRHRLQLWPWWSWAVLTNWRRESRRSGRVPTK